VRSAPVGECLIRSLLGGVFLQSDALHVAVEKLELVDSVHFDDCDELGVFGIEVVVGHGGRIRQPSHVSQQLISRWESLRFKGFTDSRGISNEKRGYHFSRMCAFYYN